MPEKQKIPVVIFFGATASGKTSVAEKLFSAGSDSELSGCAEIISADSVQVYRRLTIGSAAPCSKLTEKLPHHLIAIKEPSEEFSTADFVAAADDLCKEVYGRGKLPVLLGGTAFFLKNFMYGLPVTPKADAAVREHFQKRAKTEGISVLLEELKKNDPDTAKKLHVNDEYRIIRACEVFAATGKPLSSFALPGQYRADYDFFVLSIERERADLYARIEKRVDKMIKQGLAEEVFSLVKSGFGIFDPALKAIGYKEFFAEDGSFKGFTCIDQIAALIKRNTKHYAKRQETFFKKIENVHRYNADKKNGITSLKNDLYRFYKQYFML